MKTSRILTFIFTLLLVCVMIPVMAQSAAAADYDLWVGGEQVTDEKLSGVGWKYAPGSGTLTLTDAAITGSYTFDADTTETANIYFGDIDLIVEGTGTLSGADYGFFGIGSLTFDKAALDIRGGKSAVSTDNGYITVVGDSDVTASGGTHGFEIRVKGIFKVESGTVTATGETLAIKASVDVYEDSTVLVNEEPSASGKTEWNGTDDLGINGNFKYVKIMPKVETYTVTVTSGTGGGTYEAGESVTITANGAPTGKVFSGWSGADTLTFKDGDKDTSPATFTMPAKNVSVTATYKDFTKYDLWVGGVQVNSENEDDILDDGGKAKFDPSTNTLSFENPAITGESLVSGAGIHSNLAEPLIIKGEVTVSGEKYGIYVENDLIITEGAKVTASATVGNGYRYGIYSPEGAIKITGSDVTAQGAYQSIRAENGITVSDSTVNASGNENYCGFYTKNGDITISGESTVIDAKATSTGYGFFADYGDIIVSGGDITVSGGTSGIWSDNLTISGGKMNVSGAEGILTDHTITISGGDITVTGEHSGLDSINCKDVTISGGKLTSITTGWWGSQGGLRASESVTISGGEVYLKATRNGRGIGSKNIVISGENTVVTTDTTETGILSYNGTITIKDGAEVNVKATGEDSNAIYATDSNITISGDKTVVTAEGGKSAIFAEDGTITIANPLVILTPNDGKLSSDKKNICESDGETVAKKAVIKAGTYYDLWVGGVQVNSENKGNILGNTGEPSAVFDSDNNVLTLNNPKITGMFENNIIDSWLETLTVKGSAELINSDAEYGLFGRYLTVNGDFTISAKAWGLYSFYGLTIQNSKLNVSTEENVGIYCPSLNYNNLIIDNSEIKVKANNNIGVYAVLGDIEIRGENTIVDAEGKEAAISVSDAKIVIAPESQLVILTPNGGKLSSDEKNICESDGETIAKKAVIAKGYTVTWKNDDGTVLQSYAVAKDETPKYEGETPTKAASAGKTYEFKEWTPAIVPVTADATYTATFTEKTISILITDPETGEPVVGGTVTITDPETGEIIDSWTPDGTPHPLPGTLPPGEYIVTVELPDGSTIEMTIIVGDDGSVSIVGPDGELTPVEPGGTITIDGSTQKYIVTWIIDGKKETEEYAYGEMPSHAKPKKASDVLCDYTFTGWTPAIVKVTADATYTAQFEASLSPFSLFSPFSPFSPHSPFAPGSGTTDGSGTPDGSTTPGTGLPFTDVTPTSPYLEDIQYVYENDLMNGMSETEFGEYLPLTRGMIVTVLHRMEGRPAVAWTGVFTDVPAGMWYTDGVEWAASHGIVLGYGDGRYGPNDNVTREQLAAILHRYAKYKGYDVSVGEDTNILSYNDAFTWGDWAVPALQWACGTGVLEDVPAGMLRPTEPANRGEIAHAIHVFCEDVAK